MKLIRLKITQEGGFRSLQEGFEIHFLRDFSYQAAHEFNPTILTGRNGSGKSNVLEALANIFYHLDCMYSDYLPDGFLKSEESESGFDNTVGVVDAYELEYFVNIPATTAYKSYKEIMDWPVTGMKIHIKITKKTKEAPVVEWLNMPTDNTKEIEFDKKLYQQLLPKYVLGYSSGENELLSLPFFKTRFLHFDEYADKLRREEPYGYPPKPEGRLVYLDNDLSQAILLANLLMQNQEKDESILSPFVENVELEDIDEFRLIICVDKYLELHEDIIKDKEVSNDVVHEENHLVELTSSVERSIDTLKSCSTCYEYTSFGKYYENDEPRRFLVLDYKVTKATKEAFRFHFSDNPLQLFQLFQLLLELNAHVVSVPDKKRVYESKNIFINNDIFPNPLEDDRILRFKNLWLKKRGVTRPLFTKELSDGEHQFLHSIGLCLLFQNENALFLLDEPETHFNPDWKSEFITNVRHCFTKEEKVMREMLVTTHSPYLISDSDAKYVRVFEKVEGEDKESKLVTCRLPEFQTLGSSVNKITIEVFKTPITVGKHAFSKMNEIDDRFENGAQPEQLIKELEENLGDSVEKTLLIHKLLK